MVEQTKAHCDRIRSKKTANDVKRLTVNDAADLSVKYEAESAKAKGEKYTTEDANRDRRNAWNTMHGINIESERD